VRRWLTWFCRHFRKSAFQPLRWYGKYGIAGWRAELLDETPQPEKPRGVSARGLLREYLYRGALAIRQVRLFWHCVAYFALVFAVITICGFPPPSPVRGIVCRACDLAILWAAILAMMWLIFYVLDAVRLCDRFVRLISSDGVVWSTKLLEEAADNCGLELNEQTKPWLRHPLYVRVIGERSSLIGGYIYTPFVVLLLMILSRYRAFDYWPWPGVLMVIFLLHTAVLVYCAFLLRATARRVKQHALDALSDELRRCPAQDPERKRWALSKLIREVRENRKGAFGSYTENPILRALLIPFGGVGILVLLDALVRYVSG
jgi:hypothetical protein